MGQKRGGVGFFVVTAFVCALVPSSAHAGPFYDLAPHSSSSTMKIPGAIRVAASTATYNTATIVLDGPNGTVSASSFTGNGAALTGIPSSATISALQGVDTLLGVSSAALSASTTTFRLEIAALTVATVAHASQLSLVAAATTQLNIAVTGPGWSVGVSSLVVQGGKTYLGSVADGNNPGFLLDVRGASIFNSSVQASAYFGDGSNLAGIPSTAAYVAADGLIGVSTAALVKRSGDRMTGPLATTSTMTVEGNAFSVGGSTLVVAGGRVGIGTTNPGHLFSVDGETHIAHQNAQIHVSNSIGTSVNYSGSSVTVTAAAIQALVGTEIARFTSSGLGVGTTAPTSKLHVSSGVSVVDGSGAGMSVSGPSTATYFYGNGSGLTGISASAVPAVSTRTLGIVDVTWTNTSVGPCVAGSTVNATVTVSTVVVNFSGAILTNNPGSYVAVTVLRDGVNLAATSSGYITRLVSHNASVGYNGSFTFLDTGVSAGAHSWCLAPFVDGGTGSFSSSMNSFSVWELK